MPTPRWLLLTHQLPNKPSNLRVRVWRKLQAIGAVPVKNSIYALPNKAEAREDFEWLRKEIVQSGGEATVFMGDSVAEAGDKEIIVGFQEARTKDYAEFKQVVQTFNEKVKAALDGGHIKDAALERLERQWSAHRAEWGRLAKIDFFGASSKASAAASLADGQKLMQRAKAASVAESPEPPAPLAAKELKGKVWVTRTSPHVDRLASAWLVRRFVDPKAKFKFVTAPYEARANELRFDMPDAEFTHFGDWCTFETLARRLSVNDPVVAALAEIVHDIDLKDRKFSRPEASGIALAVRGLCRVREQDAPRLEAGLELFDGLYAALKAESKL